MVRERRNWMWGTHEESMYDYIWNKLEKQKKERRHVPLVDVKIAEHDLTDNEMPVETNTQKMKENYM
jgi:hypothetical protein